MKTMWGSMCFCAVLLVLGCEDQLGNQQGGDNTTSTASGAENSADGHTSSSDPTEQNQSANSTTTANASTPSTQSDDPREQPGQWADEENFTFLPPNDEGVEHLDTTSLRLDLCWISRNSESLILVRLHSSLGDTLRCEGEDEPKTTSGYRTFEAERLLHLGGKPVPLTFPLRRLFGTQLIRPGRDYILGLREFEEGFYSQSGALEVVLYDPDQETERVAVSGKREALIEQSEVHMSDRRQEDCRDIPLSRESFRRAHFDLDGTICQ